MMEKNKILTVICISVFTFVLNGCGLVQSSMFAEHSPIYVYLPQLDTIYVSVPDDYTQVESCLGSSKTDCNSNDFEKLELIENKESRAFFKIDNKDKLRFIHIKASKDAKDDLLGDDQETTIERMIELKNKDDNSNTSKDPKIITVDGYSCYDTTEDVCKAEYTIFKRTNELRRRSNLNELKPNIALSYLARQWSEEQARQGNISHNWFQSGVTNQKFNELKSSSFQDASQISFLSAENVAANMVQTDGEAVGNALYSQWHDSPGHYANMVGQHNYLGVGVVIGAKGTYSIYGTQIFGR